MFPWYTKKKKKTKEADDKPKTRTKSKPDLVAKLDRVFSAYIRLRDVMPNGCFRCISCGKIKRFEQGDCGHYHNRTHMATRWDPDNCHMECRECNRVLSDHLIGYRKNLVAKIGLSKIDYLDVKAHSVKHWQDFELKEMIAYYQREVKRLEAEKGIKIKC